MPLLALVDDHPILRSGIKALLDSEPGFEVRYECRHELEYTDHLMDQGARGYLPKDAE